MTNIALVGWEKFQHYGDRDPTWIKLYRDLLTSESWVLGTDISRLMQVASAMLAARYKNKIPYRWDLIKKVAHLDFSEAQFKGAIQHLVEYKFLEFQEVTEDQNSVEQSASTALAKCSSEKSREEEKREEKKRSRDVELKLDGGPVERVFEHWRSEYRHPKASLDPKRRKAIQRALEAYDEATVCAAIAGYKLSPHHMGQNEQRAVYDDISLFLRDAEHIERGLNFARAPPARVQSAVEMARERLRGQVNSNGRVVSDQSGGSSESGLGPSAGALR